MSQLSELLKEKAEEIRLSSPEEIAVEHLKQAGFSEEDARLNIAQHVMEKEATSALVQAGVDIEEATKLVKAAGVNLKDLVSYEPEIAQVHPSVELLKQAALYIETLEAELAEKESEIEKAASIVQAQEVQLPEQITKAASNGAFTFEDLAELQKMDQGVLHKLASAMDEPWEMGSAHGMIRPKTDPMLEFILG
jgi:hypothetical protein